MFVNRLLPCLHGQSGVSEKIQYCSMGTTGTDCPSVLDFADVTRECGHNSFRNNSCENNIQYCM